MSEFYTEKDVTENKFLFASYSHKDTTMVLEAIKYFFEQGVQIWFDEDMHNGDDWEQVAQRIIEHENCVGVIFFNSIHSYVSEAVAKERQLSSKKKGEWEKNNQAFHTFVVNMGKPTTLRLLRDVFVATDDNDEDLSKAFSTKQLSVILEMFPDSRIYAFLTEQNKQEVLVSLYNDIIEKAPEARNRNNLVITKAKNNEDSEKPIFIDFGFLDNKPIGWVLIKYDDKKALFLATDIVATDYGDGIEKWLNEEFLHKITASGEKLYPDEGLRLLSLEESKALSEDIMKLGSQWWLADKRGSLQTTVREDGTVYLNGYNNRRFSKGVRPVLILNEKHLEEILSK